MLEPHYIYANLLNNIHQNVTKLDTLHQRCEQHCAGGGGGGTISFHHGCLHRTIVQ